MGCGREPCWGHRLDSGRPRELSNTSFASGSAPAPVRGGRGGREREGGVSCPARRPRAGSASSTGAGGGFGGRKGARVGGSPSPRRRWPWGVAGRPLGMAAAGRGGPSRKIRVVGGCLKNFPWSCFLPAPPASVGIFKPVFSCQQVWQKVLFPRQRAEEKPQIRAFPPKAASRHRESRFSPGRHRSVPRPPASPGAHPAEPERLPGARVGGEGAGGRDAGSAPGGTHPACSPASRLVADGS